MAITTIDGAIAGLQPVVDFGKYSYTPEAAGVPCSLLYAAGNPLPGAAPGGTVTPGTALTSYAGQFKFTNPASGNTYLARLEVEATQPGTLWLCDRLWHNNPAITSGAQAITFPGLPARDANGSTNGVDVQVALEVSATTGVGSGTAATIDYTDSGGTGSNTGTGLGQQPSPVTGTFTPFSLASGDNGVRSIQSLNLNAGHLSGTLSLVCFRVIAKIGVPLVGQTYAQDGLSLGFPRMYDNTVPFLVWVPNSTNAVSITGRMFVAQG